MIRPLVSLVMALAAMLAASSNASAQSLNQTTNGGGFGQSGFSSMGFGSTGSATGTALSGSSNGLGGFGTNTGFNNGSAFGNSPTGGSGNYGSFGQSGTNARGNAYGSNSQQQGVGRTTGLNGMNGSTGNRGAAGNRQRNNNNTANRGNSRRQSTSTEPAFEPRIEVAFVYPQPTPERISTSVQRSLSLASTPARFGQIQSTLKGSIVTLRGAVASEEDRLVAAELAMLEPGVTEVRNELMVAPPATPPVPANPR